MRRESAELREWVRVKRLRGLSDAHVQMARELGMSPGRLAQSGLPVGQQIEERYSRRFRHTVADPVVPVRQLLREAVARERADARERKRRSRQSERDHLEAARRSLLTIRRFLPGGPAHDASDEAREPPSE